MFGMFKYISSFFWDDNETDLSLDEAYKVLNNIKEEANNSLEEVNDIDTQYFCYHKTGTITSSNSGYVTIDDLYEFTSCLVNLEVGTNVSFTVYDAGGILKVTNLTIIDDWHSEPINSKSSWCLRSLVCKITERQGRNVYVSPGDVFIDLNDVASEFIPIIGDWVDVEAKVELDENVTDLFGKILEVIKISPLRPRILQGKVKAWNEMSKTGYIDHVVYFNQDALVPGYVPLIGDKVITEVIESDQGRFTCRALKVMPEQQRILKTTLPNFQTIDYDTKNDYIDVSSDINIRFKTIGAKKSFFFDVTNKSDKLITLLDITFQSNITQCIILKPQELKNIQIPSTESLKFEGMCTAKNVGINKELILFRFTDFKIGRWVTVNLEIDQLKYQKARTADCGSILLRNTRFRQDNSMIRGQRVVNPPRFISVRLPSYPVPQKFLLLVSEYNDHRLLNELSRIKPCLNLPLSYNIYEDRFHTLIHMEEIYEILAMRSYACDLTCFIPNSEYLMLEIQNLNERRPSLIIGDRIIAKDPYNNNSDEYEGYIHKLGSKHVYIKFSSSYHNSYNGEDVSIIAVASRTTYRRMHQAVGLAVRNLGNSFLFPTKVETKDAQLEFVCDTHIDDNTTDTNNKHSISKLLLNTINNSEVHSTEPSNNKTVKSQFPLEKLDIKFKKHKQYTTKLEWFNQNLNCHQKKAVKNILIGKARPLPYVIFGPPGTGKTITLVETILQILQLIPHSRILVATPSNSAADLIALRLIDSGVLKPGDLVRLVAYRCVVEDILPIKLIPYCATADIAKEGTRENSCITNDNGLKLGCSSSVIGRHRITVGTCSTLGVLFNMGFSKGHFTHIVVDEAGQLREPDILIPLVFLDIFSGQTILAGDPLQLGPIVCSKAAKAYGLDETFLERILNRFPYARDAEGFPDTGGYDPRLLTKLVYNYRSLPEVLKLTSDLFYDGDLIHTISSLDSKEACILTQVQEILPKRKNSSPPAVVFHGVFGENYQTPDCPSWFNPNEASQIFFYVNELYRLGLKSTDIGIISPYIKQVRQIRSLFVEAEFELPKVGTVEEFQGQEFLVILVSTVRSNENLIAHDLDHKLGFISIPKRINVALSRARALLIIVGNPHILSTDIHWRSVIKYCIDNDSYCGSELSSDQ